MNRKPNNIQQTQRDEQWAMAQKLRRDMARLSDPLPKSCKGLFKQGKHWDQLSTRPEALNLQSLDNTPALEYSDWLTQAIAEMFNEQAAETSPSSHKPGLAEPLSTLRSADRTHQTDGSGREKSSTADFKSTAKLDNPSLETLSSSQVLSQTSVLTPEFMQEWIDEILAQDSTSNVQATQQDRSSTTALLSKKLSKDKDKDKDKDKGGSAVLNSLKNSLERAQSKQHKHQNPVPEFSPSKVSTTHSASQAKHYPSSSSLTAPSLDSLSTHSGDSVNSYASDQDSGVYSEPAMGKTQQGAERVFPDGVQLLEQLVDGSAAEVTSRAEITKQYSVATQVSPTNARALNTDLMANTALQQLEKFKTTPQTSASQQVQTAVTASALPISINGSIQSQAYQNESERIASLLNDALVEQAVQHGVDLS